MKFEKLTDTKIRITLSIKEMEQNNLSAERILSNSTDSQQFLETMINKAEKEIGFNPGDAKLLIEAIVPSNKECIFTITQLLDENRCIGFCQNSFVFKFDTFDDFTSLCIFLKNFSYLNLKSFSKKFSLIIHKNTYYVRLVEPMNSSILIDYLKSLFEEFGTDVSCFTGIDGILNEYGKIIFEKNAIIKCINSFVHKKI